MRSKLISLVAVLAVVAVSAWFVKGYNNVPCIFYGDVLGYYIYLPATFIYDNHKTIEQLPEGVEVSRTVSFAMENMRAGYVVTPKGYVLVPYTYGIALMEAPFFFLGHVYAGMKGLPATGYSPLYENAIKLSTYFYALLGCWLVYITLRRWYRPTLSLLVTILLFIGTNLFWFTLYQHGMAHVPLFFLYAVMMLFTVRLYENPSWINFLMLGFTAGLISLIRPTDIICLIIPLLYGVYNKTTLTQRLAFLKLHWTKLVAAALVFLIPIIPQLLYWKMMTGSYFFYSYGSQSFNWDKPKIIEGLFYYANGWLPYSPIMLFSLAGFFLFRRIKLWTLSLWLLFLAYVYIVYSWYCYNYINGLGSRPMIHIYPLLAIPLAAFIHWIGERRSSVLKIAVATMSLFFIALNISYSVQRSLGVLISEESNFQFNTQMLFRTKLRYNDLVTFDIAAFQPDTSQLMKIKTLACEDFNDSTSGQFIKDTLTGSGYFYSMLDEEHHPYPIKLKYSDAVFGDAKWIKCSGRFMCPQDAGYYKHLFVFSANRKGNYYLWQGCKIENKINPYAGEKLTIEQSRPGEWGRVYFFTRVPQKMEDGDDLEVDLWNIGKQPIGLDDICIELYK